MLELFFFPTPNGKKVTLLLEELGGPYKLTKLDIGNGDQFNPDYLKICPNGRMPALIDHAPKGGGAPVSVFESGAIMMYVAEREGRFWPQEPRKKYEVVQWVMWQMANQGPKLGEFGNFTRAAEKPENGDLAYGVRRFTDEAHRLFGVMNLGLYEKRYLAADEYTIADMICYPWASRADMYRIDLDEFPNVKRWLDDIGRRPAVQKGMSLGEDMSAAFADLPPEEQARRMKLLSNQRAQPIPPEWGRSP